MDLGGRWLAAEADDELRRRLPETSFDDRAWEAVTVPGHWRSVPAFAASHGPLLYRRRFVAPVPEPGRRSWLTFHGLFYQADVWLDGSYLGDTEGYFAPQTFEVTEALRSGSEHLLAVELACANQSDPRTRRNLTGMYQHSPSIDSDWNPGGIWAPVVLSETGATRLVGLRVLCHEASPERANLEMTATLDIPEARSVTLATTLGRDGHEEAGGVEVRRLAAGTNRVRWRVSVDGPALWWPHALGDQPRYDLSVTARTGGEVSDTLLRRTGLRQVRTRRFVTTVNGEALFLKGTNLGPTDRAPAEAPPRAVAADVALARAANLDLIRVHAHIAPPALYEEADRVGMLIWQDLPLQWKYGPVRREAVRQARQAVQLLGHHPSVALWCGHNEPYTSEPPTGPVTGRRGAARYLAAQARPGWHPSRLDRSIKRALERSDGSRSVLVHSGVLPHPAWGSDTHSWFGWYLGEATDLAATLARWPALARFLGEFGAQAVPVTDEFMAPGSWPDLDWERLERSHGLQRGVLARRVPPEAHATFEGWAEATRRYQAELIRVHVETLRRLKYRPTGGFCQYLLADAQPSVSWSVLDHERIAKRGYAALAAACAPVIVTAEGLEVSYRPGSRVVIRVHAVSDLRRPLPEAQVDITLSWPGGRRTWTFGGDIPADRCTRIARLEVDIPPDADPGPLEASLRMAWTHASGEKGSVTNFYRSTVSTGPAVLPDT